MRPRRRDFGAVLIVAAALVSFGAHACKRSRASTATEVEQPPVVRDESEGLLLTWVDDKGDFHVESRVTDVPLMGRDAVRVVDPAKDDQSRRERVFLADLRQLRADGTYPVRSMARLDFEAIAVARREKGGPTLANGATAPSASGASDNRAAAPGAAEPVSRPLVIIYGAEWCGACHEAARYLRRKGIAYIEKDIEKDPSAAREMQEKLAKNGLRTGSIPIIDVRGKVMVGFSPDQVEAALGQPL
jgi:glutaredoxin